MAGSDRSRPGRKRLRDSGRGIGCPSPLNSAGNGPRPSGSDRGGWVRVEHSRPEWLGHRVGPRVPRQRQDSTRLNTFSIKPSTVLALSRHWLGTVYAMACQTKGRRSEFRNRAGHALTGQFLGESIDFAEREASVNLNSLGIAVAVCRRPVARETERNPGIPLPGRSLSCIATAAYFCVRGSDNAFGACW
jgi:hypothetical protein